MTAFKRVAYSLQDLLSEVNARWPDRSRISDGSLGDPAHAARVSDHNPDANGVVRARDFTEWDPGTPENEADDVAEVIAETIRARRDPRIKYVIWRDRMFSSYPTSSTPAWTWRVYNGPNKHRKHCHVSVQPGDTGDVSGPWGIHPSTTTPTPPTPQGPFDMLTEAEQNELLTKTRDIHNELMVTVKGKTRMDRLADLVSRSHGALERIEGSVKPKGE